ncbi:14662_t:CDS:1, partial [Gigaspora rosea]
MDEPVRGMRRKKIKKKTYLYDRMDEDKWKEFAATVSRTMENSNWQNTIITDEIALNKYWIAIHETIKAAANKHIPYT